MFSDITLFQYILLFLLLVTFLIQLYYHIRYYFGALFFKPQETTGHNQPVSVVICARNEEENLKRNLPAILTQRHKNYEVIVVNDCSEDNSAELLAEMQQKHPALKVSELNIEPRFRQGKKFAQLIGIKAASHELILLTDADCIPESEDWLTTMSEPLANGKSFVLGYGGYMPGRGILNRYIRYDTLFIALQYLGMAIAGRPSIGVGRNLAYRKSLFLTNNGYSAHYHIASGDDDLFVNANATDSNTAVEFRTEAHTRSAAKRSFRELLRQKRRHMSTAPLYKRGDRVILAGEPATRVLFFAAVATVATMGNIWPAAALSGGVRLISLLIITHLSAKKMNERGLTIPAIFFDIISPVLNSLFYISSLINRKGDKGWR